MKKIFLGKADSKRDRVQPRLSAEKDLKELGIEEGGRELRKGEWAIILKEVSGFQTVLHCSQGHRGDLIKPTFCSVFKMNIILFCPKLNFICPTFPVGSCSSTRNCKEIQ